MGHKIVAFYEFRGPWNQFFTGFNLSAFSWYFSGPWNCYEIPVGLISCDTKIHGLWKFSWAMNKLWNAVRQISWVQKPSKVWIVKLVSLLLNIFWEHHFLLNNKTYKIIFLFQNKRWALPCLEKNPFNCIKNELVLLKQSSSSIWSSWSSICMFSNSHFVSEF